MARLFPSPFHRIVLARQEDGSACRNVSHLTVLPFVESIILVPFRVCVFHFRKPFNQDAAGVV